MNKLFWCFIVTLSISGCTFKDGNFVLFDKQSKSGSGKTQPKASLPSETTAVKAAGTKVAVSKPMIQAKAQSIVSQPEPRLPLPPPIVEKEDANKGQVSSQKEQEVAPWPITAKPMTPPPTIVKTAIVHVQMPVEKNEVKMVWHFDPYQRINIEGNLDLKVVEAKDGRDTLTVMDDPGALLKSGAKDGVLTLQLVTYATYPKAVLAVPNLKSLAITGFGDLHSVHIPTTLRELNLLSCGDVRLAGDNVRIQKLLVDRVKSVDIQSLQTDNLLMWVRQSGPVTLKGVVGLRELDTAETSSINIQWINSPLLTVRLNRSTNVFLAGTANVVTAYLQDHAKLDAKYLRTKTGFIETSGDSEAQVMVLDSLNALAAGTSNIYYYLQPKLIGRYFRDQGSVLYMGDTIPDCQTPMCPLMPNPLPG